MKCLYQLTTDAGEIIFISAKTRKQAKEIFCEEKGVNEDYIKNHCLVENLGVVVE